jgi:pyridoxamine 5'-phosphate oxidase
LLPRGRGQAEGRGKGQEDEHRAMTNHAAGEHPVTRLRRDYSRADLSEATVAPDPIVQFDRWFQEALSAELTEPNAMTLATATPDGQPAARIVLLRGYDARGFVFYSSYESQKGRELAANPRAALVCYWAELERQVRITGRVEQLTRAESEQYFRGRPRGSQLSAWASHQSQVIPSRAALEERWRQREAEFDGRPVPLPPFWGGYRVEPQTIEFWQGRPNRLHDRLRYTRQPAGGWLIERLSP